MTKKELEIERREFLISAKKLARTTKRLKEAIKKIEEQAEAHEGELSERDAVRHEILHRLYTSVFEDVGAVLLEFQD